MEAAALTPSTPKWRSFERPGKCESVVPRDREPRTCGGRRRACADETSVAALRYRRSERTALYIETQEGDVVRLSIKVRSALDANVGQTKGEVDIAELRVNARSAVRVRFSVEGELNAEERDAIQSVVEQASGLAAELFAGDVPEAFATAAALEIDGTQLARVGLRMSVREHLTYSARSDYRSVAAPLPSPVPEQLKPAQTESGSSESVPSEQANAPAATTSVPAVTTSPSVSAAPEASSDVAVEPTDGPAEPATPEPASAEAPVPAATPNSTTAVLDTIGKFLAHLLDSLAHPPAGGDDTPSMALSLKLRVFKAVTLTLAATQVSAPDERTSGMPLLADTLDALAAHEEPVDARV